MNADCTGYVCSVVVQITVGNDSILTTDIYCTTSIGLGICKVGIPYIGSYIGNVDYTTLVIMPISGTVIE